MDNGLEFTLKLDSPDLDEEELDQARTNLLDELVELDGCTAEVLPEGKAPPGAKGEPVTLGTIVISLASAGVLTALVECLRSWLSRDDRHRVQLLAEIEGNTIFIDSTQFSGEEVERLVAMVTSGLRK